ncbi:MAG TPA: right-handed parallel beta-helix repeat-containing protein [Candidatus Baltobacteraceae bacterium]|nr:right-handed parallel beta-helix repeat-containing protein [Candidatus Baltobacteraceae bacterium]
MSFNDAIIPPKSGEPSQGAASHARGLSLRLGAFAIVVLLFLVFLIPLSGLAATLEVGPVTGDEGIRQALDQVGAGGQVTLTRGTYVVHEPIILRQNGQTLRGAGPETILWLADNANCPVIILGPPKDKTKRPTRGLNLRDLLVDGNRTHQQNELWRILPNGAAINNNGIQVCLVVDATIEHVICRSCRSGGLVSTGETRRLTLRDYTAYDNQFDGLACYRSEGCHFSQLNLHDNMAAGISLDLGFDHNIIDGAVLTGNDLGVFMRDSRDNVFEGVTIRHSRHDGIFMAQAGDMTVSGWQLFPGTECTGNTFDNLRVVDCGGRAFQVNDGTCTNNKINVGEFLDNAQGGLRQPPNNPVIARALTVAPLP